METISNSDPTSEESTSKNLNETAEDLSPPEIITPEPTPPGVPRSKYPPVLTLLKSRRLLVALWGCVVQAACMTAFDSVVPLYGM